MTREEALALLKKYNKEPFHLQGGRGCVRDIVEQVLRARGQWALHGKGVNCSKEAKSE